ncbi:MAG: NAD(P)H-hydrate dehydratase [Thermodesulfobacteriota bacterium]
MFAVVGTIAHENFPLTRGEVRIQGENIGIQDQVIPVHRGTPALLAAAVKAGEVLGLINPTGFLVGDIGRGKGSRTLYEFLVNILPALDFRVLTFHYLQPDVDWHNRVLFAVEEMSERPLLVADAGFMYAAKMSGQAEEYDLFTPDLGELAFLADEEAPHPFYTRGFILHEDQRVPELIARAYQHKNAARHLLVKGQKDVVVHQGKIKAVIDRPMEEALEAIGGTGDTLTGIVSALIYSGMDMVSAAVLAARVNRLAGHYAKPTPATQIIDIIHQIPRALEEALKSQLGTLCPKLQIT